MQIGIFGGSFNPIHIGHLALANYLCEYNEVDEVWFFVSPHNPLKERGDLWPDEFRLKLVQLAIEGYEKFKASDFEFHLPRPSYMVNTLRELRSSYPEHEFILIIGSDNWEVFPRWHKYEELLTENKLIIYPRPGYPIDKDTLPPNVHMVETPLLDISSTFIRQAFKEGKDVRYFVPKEVYGYIRNAGITKVSKI